MTCRCRQRIEVSKACVDGTTFGKVFPDFHQWAIEPDETREVNGTLTHLQTNFLDLYIIHRFDYDTPMEETMETLGGAVSQGDAVMTGEPTGLVQACKRLGKGAARRREHA